jgi:hypothetical protein
MIAGHFGFAAGVKGRQPQVPLWALMLATVWLDILFAPLLAAGSRASTPCPAPVAATETPLSTPTTRTP